MIGRENIRVNLFILGTVMLWLGGCGSEDSEPDSNTCDCFWSVEFDGEQISSHSDYQDEIIFITTMPGAPNTVQLRRAKENTSVIFQFTDMALDENLPLGSYEVIALGENVTSNTGSHWVYSKQASDDLGLDMSPSMLTVTENSSNRFSASLSGTVMAVSEDQENRVYASYSLSLQVARKYFHPDPLDPLTLAKCLAHECP